MLGFLHCLGEKNQKARHQCKDGKKTETNGFDEDQSHIEANTKLHKHHGGQAGNGCETAGKNSGNGGTECRDTGTSVIQCMLTGL